MSQDDFLVENVALDLQPNSENESVIIKKVFDRCKGQMCLKPLGEEVFVPDNKDNNISSSLFDAPASVIEISPSLTKPSIKYELYAPNFIEVTEGQEVIKLLPNSVSNIELATPIATNITLVKLISPGQFCKSKLYDVTLKYDFTYKIKLLDDNYNPISVNIQKSIQTVPSGNFVADGNPTVTTEIDCKVTFFKTVSLKGGYVDPKTLVATLDTSTFNYINKISSGNPPDVYAQASATPLDVSIGVHKVNSTTVGVPPTDSSYIDVTIGLFSLTSIYRLSVLNISSFVSDGTELKPYVSPDVTDNCCDFGEINFPISVFDPKTNEE